MEIGTRVELAVQPPSDLGRLAYAVRRAIQAFRRHRQMRQTIGTLQDLDDRTLADIGLKRSDIEVVIRGAHYRKSCF